MIPPVFISWSATEDGQCFTHATKGAIPRHIYQVSFQQQVRPVRVRLLLGLGKTFVISGCSCIGEWADVDSWEWLVCCWLTTIVPTRQVW